MLDINLIRKNPEQVAQALKKRMDDIDFTNLLVWDEKRRAHIAEAGQLRAKRNSVSAQIPQMKKARHRSDTNRNARSLHPHQNH